MFSAISTSFVSKPQKGSILQIISLEETIDSRISRIEIEKQLRKMSWLKYRLVCRNVSVNTAQNFDEKLV